ncbi:hypothetical protein BHM03_00028333 [Ensete ventricosum]|uniref:Uncharacterized protein n=1 Tax=Ensete ventricosum TaxID=4639 RepID=A0A445MI16_ENSVE|nr:hypothetical protein BHM03_00028333 [Ensete ventricosum]
MPSVAPTALPLLPPTTANCAYCLPRLPPVPSTSPSPDVSITATTPLQEMTLPMSPSNACCPAASPALLLNSCYNRILNRIIPSTGIAASVATCATRIADLGGPYRIVVVASSSSHSLPPPLQYAVVPQPSALPQPLSFSLPQSQPPLVAPHTDATTSFTSRCFLLCHRCRRPYLPPTAPPSSTLLYHSVAMHSSVVVATSHCNAQPSVVTIEPATPAESRCHPLLFLPSSSS